MHYFFLSKTDIKKKMAVDIYMYTNIKDSYVDYRTDKWSAG